MRSSVIRVITASAALVIAVTVGIPKPALADTTSTAAIVAGAASLLGALLVDGNDRPVEVRDDRRWIAPEQPAGWTRDRRDTDDGGRNWNASSLRDGSGSDGYRASTVRRAPVEARSSNERLGNGRDRGDRG